MKEWGKVMKKTTLCLKSSVIALLFSFFISFAENNYLTKSLPTIKEGLKANTEELIKQKQIINLAQKALDTLVKHTEITASVAEVEKFELESIFDLNLKKASSQQRIVYQIKLPLQFVYSKLTDPDSTPLERFAYGTAIAAG